MIKLSSWKDFINYQGQFSQKILALKSSNLPEQDPGSLRPL
jgi:hypothetical protein